MIQVPDPKKSDWGSLAPKPRPPLKVAIGYEVRAGRMFVCNEYGIRCVDCGAVFVDHQCRE